MRRCLLALCALLLSCTASLWWRGTFRPVADPAVDPDAPFLKCHATDGELYVLERWTIDSSAKVVRGEGLRYDADRRKIGAGRFEIPFERVSVAETNEPEKVVHAEIPVVVLAAAPGAGLGWYCAVHPKSCFGSCPTFYARDGEREVLQAEGFSASVARALEDTDVDAIDPPRSGRVVELTMRNEALETHFVRSVRVLAVPRPAGARVYRAGDRYLPAEDERPPRACAAPGRDCLVAVSAADGVEDLSRASPRDLAEDEVIELAFPPVAGSAGLVVRARTSLLETYVFYQGLAWLGADMGAWLARIERAGPGGVPVFAELERLLGGIRVEALGAHGWEPAGAFREVGPIARETQVVPLPQLPPGEVRLRLRVTRGNWRIDRLALVRLGAPIAPVAVPLAGVTRSGAADPEALARLSGHGERLVTYPGDAYALRFELPPGLEDAELFLESRGYYYEWMRRPWLAERDPERALELAADPRAALRRMAPAYARVEPEMDAIFWSTRAGSRP